MNEEDIQARYEIWHQRRVELQEDSNLGPWHKTVLRLLPDLAGRNVLEVGCGTGTFTRLLAARFPTAHFTGVDFSQAAILTAKRESKRIKAVNVFYEVQDAQSMTIPNESIDFVISCECLEHIPQPGKMAQEMARVLRANGRWILTTENYFNGMLLAWLMSAWRKHPFDSGSGIQPHENFFLYWRVKKILERGGLRVERMESNHFQWLLLPRVSPDRLRTDDFSYELLRRLFRPFGRHFTFQGSKRSQIA